MSLNAHKMMIWFYVIFSVSYFRSSVLCNPENKYTDISTSVPEQVPPFWQGLFLLHGISPEINIISFMT